MKYLIPPMVDEHRIDHISLLNIYLNSLIAVMDTLRYNDFEHSSVDIAKAYSFVTTNKTFAVASINNNDISKYRPELLQFIKLRVLKVVQDAIEIIQIHELDNSQVNNIELCNLTMRDLRLIEFEVLRACENVEKARSQKDSKLANSQIINISETLGQLIRYFNNLSQKVKFSTSSIQGYYRPDVNNDSDSINVIVLVGHLIAHVASCILAFKHNLSTDFTDASKQSKLHNELSKELIFDEFIRYSNIGTMSFGGILCCYKNIEGLSVIVLNPNGSLGMKEKEFLTNLLMISKLTE